MNECFSNILVIKDFNVEVIQDFRTWSNIVSKVKGLGGLKVDSFRPLRLSSDECSYYVLILWNLGLKFELSIF